MANHSTEPAKGHGEAFPSGAALYPPDLPAAGVDAGISPDELSQRPTVKGAIKVTCIDYCPQQCIVQEAVDLPEFLKSHRPPWSVVRWISVRGLKDMEAIRAIAEKYELHPLAP